MNGGNLLNEFKHAFNRPNNAHTQLIIINVVVFLVVVVLKVFLTLSGGEGLYYTVLSYLQLPSSLNTLITQPWSVITYFFTHEGFFHILFNMLFLYWFGRLIQEYLGSDKVISLYVLGGLAGAFFFLLIYNISPYFSEQVERSMMLGASAGVFAIVVGSATLMPNYTFYLLFLGPVKIKYIAIFYVVLSFVNSTGQNAGGELAHLGGALIGFLYIRQLQKGSDWGTWITSFRHFVSSFFVKQSNIKVSYKKQSSSQKRKTSSTSTPKNSSSKASQDEIDNILDKISEKGYESLTKEEKEKLFNASKK